MDLNLLPSEAKFQAQRIHFRQKARMMAKIIVGIWIVSILVVFGVWFGSNQLLTREQNSYSNSLTAFNGLTSSIALNQKLRYQAKLVGQILDSRYEYAKAFTTIKSFLPDGVAVNRLELGKENIFQIEATAGDNQTMDLIEKKVESVNRGEVEGFKSVALQSIQDNRNSWKLTLEVTLK